MTDTTQQSRYVREPQQRRYIVAGSEYSRCIILDVSLTPARPVLTTADRYHDDEDDDAVALAKAVCALMNQDHEMRQQVEAAVAAPKPKLRKKKPSGG